MTGIFVNKGEIWTQREDKVKRQGKFLESEGRYWSERTEAKIVRKSEEIRSGA
jgi:hypothetical protein